MLMKLDLHLKLGFISSEKYYSPDNQINNTQGYNEMDYYRIQNGQRKQPDYIVVFRRNGKIENLDLAEKASKDWGEMPIVVIDVNKCLESEKMKTEELLKIYKKEKNPEIARELYYKIINNRKTVECQYKYCGEKLPDFFPEIDETMLEEMKINFTQIVASQDLVAPSMTTEEIDADRKSSRETESSSTTTNTSIEYTAKSTEKPVSENDLAFNFEQASATERVNEVGRIGGVLQQIQTLSRNMESEEIGIR